MSLRHALAFVFAVAPLLATGCATNLSSSTAGDEGKLTFAYSEVCFFGCAVDKPILLGARARISVTGDALSLLEARSEDETIVTVTTERSYLCCRTSGTTSSCAASSETQPCEAGYEKSVHPTLVVTTHSEGATRVILEDRAGHAVDALRLEVRRAGSVTLRVVAADGPREVSGVEMKPSEVTAIDALVQDTAGKPLHAPNGFSLAIADPAVVSFDDPSFVSPDADGLLSVERDRFGTVPKLRARTVGATTLRVITKGWETTFPVKVS